MGKKIEVRLTEKNKSQIRILVRKLRLRCT